MSRWTAPLPVPHALARLERPRPTAAPSSRRTAEYAQDTAAVRLALGELFAADGFPSDFDPCELRFLRDPLGKPYVAWNGALAAWAAARGRRLEHLHVSNTHDGAAQIVFAAYAESLVGVGVDVVYLPRLRHPGKGADYLRRFARQFMSPMEWGIFESASAADDEEGLRRRVAAHFSLMEAASKACGTGLKIGAGMGKPTSLPKHALGAETLAPAVRLLFGPEAQERLSVLGANRAEAHWSLDDDYLLSLVLLFA
jgi:phosphopantetheinyl transferase (holo-ACP synthase)